MEVIYIIILLFYAFYIIQLYIGFDKIETAFYSENVKPKTAFTIIVPFRNEAKNLQRLLDSFSNLNYPKELIEIIMIDDNSKDKSSSIFIQWRIKNDEIDTTLLENLRLSKSPKKDAIARAMPIAKNSWIITTDADCKVKKNWLLSFDQFIQNNSVEMIAAPVIYETKNNWFHQFQQIDLMSLQATTIGSFGIGKPFMCNGANFAYTKQIFQELDGFNGNNSISSGDDVFLLQKAIQLFPEKVNYLKSKSSIVTTKPENDLFTFFMQRVRWASKTTSYNNLYPKTLALIVLLTNTLFVISIIDLFTNFINWKISCAFIVVKYILEFLLVNKASAFLNKNKLIFPLSSFIIYPFYVMIVGVYSLFGKFSWKERIFNK